MVAVNSFTDNLTVSVAEQAQALLGADLAITSRKPLSEIKPAQRLLDSLRATGGSSIRVATSVSFAAMAYLPGSGGARLVQLRSVEPGWPSTARRNSPAGAWDRLHDGSAWSTIPVTAIGAAIGDTLALGGRFSIAEPWSTSLATSACRWPRRTSVRGDGIVACHGLLGFGARVHTRPSCSCRRRSTRSWSRRATVRRSVGRGACARSPMIAKT